VKVKDEYKGDEFTLKAMLFVTINDWPALGNLSGFTRKGYKACIQCLEDTDSIYLKHCRKVVYMGHRRFLSKGHPLCKKGSMFDGKADHHLKPAHHSGKRVFAMVKDLKVVLKGKET